MSRFKSGHPMACLACLWALVSRTAAKICFPTFFCVFMLYCLHWTYKLSAVTVSLMTPSKHLWARWTFLRFSFVFFLHFFAKFYHGDRTSRWCFVNVRARDPWMLDRSTGCSTWYQPEEQLRFVVRGPRNEPGENQTQTNRFTYTARARSCA